MKQQTGTYDLIVIGAGPGGYVAAIRAAQEGMRVACVDKRTTLGGTCLNVGCIPSKALLAASHKYTESRHALDAFGVRIAPEHISFDLPAMMAHKDRVVADNTQGIEFLFRKNRIDRLSGHAEIIARGMVKVGGGIYTTKTILIATGSEVMPLAGVPIDEKRIVSSTGALALGHVPAHLVVIGAGVIGLELGSVWQRLGANVTVVESCDRILPSFDAELASSAQKMLEKQGLVFRLGTKVRGIVVPSPDTGHAGSASSTLREGEGGAAPLVVSLGGTQEQGREQESKASPHAASPAGSASPAEETLTADTVLVAIGRRPYTQGLGLERIGVDLDERGRIVTDGRFQTSVEGIYAIGDVIAGPMLAHKAEDEGIAVAEILTGQAGHVNYGVIPSIVYTAPEIAAVGKSEEELNAAGIPYRTGKFPYRANGRARAMNETEGFVKILAHAETDRLLGAHILGAEAGTLIAELAVAMEFGATAEDIARTCHAHPTLSEIIREAALAVDNRALHV